MRMATRELGERAFTRGDLSSPEDVCMLFVDELVYYADGGLAKIKEIADERRAHFRWLTALEPPLVVNGQPSSPAEWRHRPDPAGGQASEPLGPGDALLGTAGCAGIGRGQARILADPASPQALGPGDVLVVPTFEPGWLPLLVGAAAIVADGAGPLSHATVLARELGVPCVVSASSATTLIPEGALVEVDGLAGVISVIEVPRRESQPQQSTEDPWSSRAY
jgi:pyruvate,water dikinase